MSNRSSYFMGIWILSIAWVLESLLPWAFLPNILVFSCLYLTIYAPNSISPAMVFFVGLSLDIIHLGTLGIYPLLLLALCYAFFVRNRILVMSRWNQTGVIVLLMACFGLAEALIQVFVYHYPWQVAQFYAPIVAGVIYSVLLQIKRD